mmetsp:Transcript_902/g.1105  ORF Transcript_902/g.1105 Transcript_902/m.1105 type:complete len:261 (+) Transcript_902:24-806(+)
MGKFSDGAKIPVRQGEKHKEKEKKKKSNDKDDDSKRPPDSDPLLTNGSITAAAISQITRLALLKAFLGIIAVLYILNQQHLLPRQLSAIVSQVLFWPTLPITLSRRIGKWITRVDDTVLIGGAPYGNYPEKLYGEHGVRGVINLCEEFRGPLRKYKELGIEELHLPTTDHFAPAEEDLVSAIAFIRRHEARGKCVYVHCKAGHGRSAATVFSWLMYKDPIVDLQSLNKKFCKLRKVKSTLWQQPNIRSLHDRIKKGTLLL